MRIFFGALFEDYRQKVFLVWKYFTYFLGRFEYFSVIGACIVFVLCITYVTI